jgi:hypothetical protein
MASADLAIGAGGTTSWERLCLGLPALVVTLSLMILLTILAVGLLSLSAVSLRTTTQAQDQQTARANARLAMMIAIGELQKTLGPDQRVSAPADLAHPSATMPHWVGVYGNKEKANYLYSVISTGFHRARVAGGLRGPCFFVGLGLSGVFECVTPTCCADPPRRTGLGRCLAF